MVDVICSGRRVIAVHVCVSGKYLGKGACIYQRVRYAVVFYWIRTDIQGAVSGVIYIVHTLMGCGLLGITTGTLGFICTYSVVRRIYSAVKVKCSILA